MPPELFGKRSVVEEGAQVFHCARRIAVGTIFEDVIKAVVEHDGVVDLAHRLADDARLTERHPILKAAFDDEPLRRHFGDGVVVEHGRLDRVAHPAPMDGRHPVARLRHRADVHEAGRIFLPAVIDGVDDVLRRAVVDLHRPFRVVIGGRRHEGGDVQDEIAPLHALFDDFIIIEIAPLNRKPLGLHVGCEQASVLFGIAGENDDVLFVGIFEHLFEGCKAHAARCARDEYALFHVTPLSWRRCFWTCRREYRRRVLRNRRSQIRYRRAERRAARSQVFYR